VSTTAPQHLQALSKANEVRLARAEVKRSVAAGRTRAAQLILDPPEILLSARHPILLAEVLTWQHQWGRARAVKFCHEQGISVTAALRHLSEARRRRVAEALAL